MKRYVGEVYTESPSFFQTPYGYDFRQSVERKKDYVGEVIRAEGLIFRGVIFRNCGNERKPMWARFISINAIGFIEIKSLDY